MAGLPLETCLVGLDERLHGVKTSDASAGLLALLGAMLDLLVGFIGEDLTVRLVREVWPDLPDQEPVRPGADGQESP